MKTVSFSNGDTMPQFGLGTWLSKPDEVYHAVLAAIRAGYRHLDCAYIYRNEKEVGEALRFAFETGLVRRDELFITSKLWNSFHHPDEVERAIHLSLNDLQLDYLDLYLMHWPIAFRKDFAERAEDLISLDEIPLETTWQAMIALKKKGLAKHIGVSNFNIPKLKRLFTAEVKPEMNQVEIHPYFQQDELVRFCDEHGVLVTAYSPLGSKHLIKTDATITQHPTVLAIAEKHRCTAAQVIIAWGLARGTVVIPKSVHPERIRENAGALSVQLDAEDMARLSTLNRDLRNSQAQYAVFPGGAYSYRSIWEE